MLWFDALVGNVDRSWRNPNMLFWHGRLQLIDHGAALTFHHHWPGAPAAVDRPYDASAHALLECEPQVPAADADLAPRVTRALLEDVLAQVPDEWLEDDDLTASAQRARYADQDAFSADDPVLSAALSEVRSSPDGKRTLPYSGIPTLLGLPHAPNFMGLDIAVVGVPMDLGVSNRAGARFGPRALRTIERIGPYHPTLHSIPHSRVRAADVGDVPFRSRYSLKQSLDDIGDPGSHGRGVADGVLAVLCEEHGRGERGTLGLGESVDGQVLALLDGVLLPA